MRRDDGFTFMETLASAALVMLLSAGIASAFVSFSRNRHTADAALDEAGLLLRTDSLLRKTVSALDFPYWENQERLAQLWIADFLSRPRPEHVEYTAVAPVRDSSDRVRGVAISYRLYGVHDYECVCLFASSGVPFE